MSAKKVIVNNYYSTFVFGGEDGSAGEIRFKPGTMLSVDAVRGLRDAYEMELKEVCHERADLIRTNKDGANQKRIARLGERMSILIRISKDLRRLCGETCLAQIGRWVADEVIEEEEKTFEQSKKELFDYIKNMPISGEEETDADRD